jgi:hypothetical protein
MSIINRKLIKTYIWTKTKYFFNQLTNLWTNTLAYSGTVSEEANKFRATLKSLTFANGQKR